VERDPQDDFYDWWIRANLLLCILIDQVTSQTTTWHHFQSSKQVTIDKVGAS
jgi:hypothetical protein